MPDDAKAKINEYVEYIKRLNNALHSVGYGAEAVIVTFQPRMAILHGPRAEAVANNLLQAERIRYCSQIFSKGRYAKRAYIAEFYDK
jgi:hypothetical protein